MLFVFADFVGEMIEQLHEFACSRSPCAVRGTARESDGQALVTSFESRAQANLGRLLFAFCGRAFLTYLAVLLRLDAAGVSAFLARFLRLCTTLRVRIFCAETRGTHHRSSECYRGQ